MKQNYLFYPLKLQLFADDETGTSEVENEDNQGTDKQEEVKTFTQEDIDKIIKGRVAKERKQWEKELEEQKTEAEKLATMSEKDKKAYQEKKRQEDLDAREAAITRRELTAQAKVQLADKGIPTELAEILNLTDADTCKKSIETVEKVFQSAVEKAVEERLKGKAPMKKAPASNGITLETIKNMSSKEINEHWDEVQKIMKEQ